MRELELDGWVYPYTVVDGHATFDIVDTDEELDVYSSDPVDIRAALRLRHSHELHAFRRARASVPHLRLVHSR